MGLILVSTGRIRFLCMLSGGCVWPPQSTHSHINAKKDSALSRFASNVKAGFSPVALAA